MLYKSGALGRHTSYLKVYIGKAQSVFGREDSETPATVGWPITSKEIAIEPRRTQMA